MPCTRCFRAKRTCRMAEGAKTCQGCKNLKRPCDGLVVASSLKRLSDQRQEWEAKEEQASDALLGLHEKLARVQAEVAEAAGRLSRIRAIRKKVKERHVETFSRGMQELEEDDVLPALDAHESGVVGDLQFQGVENNPDWASFGIGEEFADLGPLLGDSQLVSSGGS
ncbi:hypothetical protein CKAH01_13336 [Colletotrichum kahawae]|uniref:Zn(2)-C6 fungal-type domain-containing protein n=1 Tax=Colletotrichum kahawae TaxID=34407 RepID=A0AAE0DA08_COLKA|nr:hypothetical protein CKAH01_13336 [Colletotrichum kahawae]